MRRDNESDRRRGGGLGVCGVLTIVFVVLKLTEVISWNWLWVLSPVWISAVFWFVLCAIYFACHWNEKGD